jgi:hypothetical protein
VPQRRNDFYFRIGDTCRPLPLAVIPLHQVPPTITFPNSTSINQPPAPSRAWATTWLRGLPAGCSPQMAFARDRISGCGTGLAGTTLAKTLSCWVTCTSYPSATQRKISDHCSANG